MEKNLDYVKKRASALETHQRPWLPVWQETAHWIAPWLCPHAGGAGGGNAAQEPAMEGAKHILDGTATRALRLLAAGLHSGLTSPARPWFRLRNNGIHEFGPERMWLDTVEEALYALFAGSNFYQAMHSMYADLAVFGSAAMYMEEDAEQMARFTTLRCGEFSWSTNAAGKVDTVLRRMRMPLRQVAERWGEEGLSHNTRRALEKDPEQLWEMLHLVEPRHARNPLKKGGKHMPFASYVWEASGGAHTLLHEGGYEEFPYLCARWDTQGGDVYGRSPAMESLPDIRLLQEMVKSQILAIHKVVNPPMRVPAGFKQRLSLVPGAVNYVTQNQPEGIGPLYQISPDLTAISRKIEDVRQAVRQGFFNDLFLMFTGEQRSNVTATEVHERGQEKLLMLGPVIERHQTEILNPLLVRSFGMLLRSGEVEEAPPGLRGNSVRIDYVSALAQAQRLDGVEAMRNLALEVGRIASIAPQVLDKIDFDQMVDEMAQGTGVSSRVVRSDSEVERLREEKTAAAAESNPGASSGASASGSGGASGAASGAGLASMLASMAGQGGAGGNGIPAQLLAALGAGN